MALEPLQLPTATSALPTAARPALGRGSAARGLRARVPRPLSPNSFPAREARGSARAGRGAQGAGEVEGRSLGHLPGGLPLRRPGRARVARCSLRAAGAPRRGLNSGGRGAPVRPASPQPPLPSACLLLWSPGLMN